jgi:hypothetical protein
MAHITSDEPESIPIDRPSLDDYVIIMTDRILDGNDWTHKDIVEIDDLYHTRVNNPPPDLTAFVTPNDNQIGIPFKNRSKLIVIEKNRGSYILNATRGDILIPRYMYLTTPLLDIDHKDKYLPNNLSIRNRIEIPLSNFGLETNPETFIAMHIIRIVFNYAVRDFRTDDIFRIVNSELHQIADELSDAIEITQLSDVIGYECSVLFEICLTLMTKYNMFEKSYMNHHRISTILNVLEKIYDINDKKSRGSKKNLITIRPTFLMHLTGSSDLWSLVTIMGRIIRNSQIDRNVGRRYEIVSTDDNTALISSLLGKDITPRVIDITRDIAAHEYLVWLWKRYTYPVKKSGRDRRRDAIKKSRWNKIKKMFEHTPETIYTSMNWVVDGTNSIEDVREYIRSILLDPITLSYVKKTWKRAYEYYFHPSLSKVISIIETYIFNVKKTAVSQASESRRLVSTDTSDIVSLIRQNIMTPKNVVEIFRGAIRGFKYYESLRETIVQFDESLRGSKVVATSALPEIATYESDSDSRPKWLDWRQYRNISISLDRNMCYECNAIGCDNTCVCGQEKDTSILFCNSYNNTGATIEKMIESFGHAITFVPLKTLIEFTRAHSRIAMYHHSDIGTSHTIDPINIQSVTYVIFLMRILMVTKLLTPLTSNLNIKEITFDIHKPSLKKLRRFIKKSLNTAQVISMPELEKLMRFLIHNLIRTFHIIRYEVEYYYPKITKSFDYDEDDSSRLVKYKESGLLDTIIEHNDLVGMTRVVYCEIESSYEAINLMFSRSETEKSIGMKIMKDYSIE